MDDENVKRILSIATTPCKPGWRFLEIPRIPLDWMARLMVIIGEENIEWLTVESYDDGTMSADIFISPIGKQAISIFRKSMTAGMH